MATLVVGRDAGGQRHFLEGRPIRCGDSLELLLPGGLWIPVRFELEPDPIEGMRPVLYLGLGGSWESWAPPDGAKEGDEVLVDCVLCARNGWVKDCVRCGGRGEHYAQVVRPGAPRATLRAADGWAMATLRWPA